MDVVRISDTEVEGTYKWQIEINAANDFNFLVSTEKDIYDVLDFVKELIRYDTNAMEAGDDPMTTPFPSKNKLSTLAKKLDISLENDLML